MLEFNLFRFLLKIIRCIAMELTRLKFQLLKPELEIFVLCICLLICNLSVIIELFWYAKHNEVGKLIK